MVAPHRRNMVASDISTSVFIDPRIKLFSRGERKKARKKERKKEKKKEITKERKNERTNGRKKERKE